MPTLRNRTSAVFTLAAAAAFGQSPVDSALNERFSVHLQATEVVQYKPAFSAAYSGPNSLSTEEETRTSITTTLFLGARLWKGAEFFFNPELAGGSGLTGALGVASSTNGETFRVGDPQPQFYSARVFLRQNIALGSGVEEVDADANVHAGHRPKDRITITVGKICMADLFDNNRYSHDPRTQFLSWGLMDNGAWDYSANVRGYTPAFAVELFKGHNEFRYALSLLPEEANGATMNWAIGKSRGQMAEYVRNYNVSGHPGAVRLLAYLNVAGMGNYRESIALDPSAPSIIATRQDGRTKWGLGLNAEQELTKDLGVFLRAGWNDGNNETWCFTEIDAQVSGGIALNGTFWHRPKDVVGLAFIGSGLSDPHKDYLAHGGDGFILGDGALAYAYEKLAEFDYSCALRDGIWLSGAYQFVADPGYNSARGPVNVFSLRLHAEI